eukprot:gene10008-biopygen1624
MLRLLPRIWGLLQGVYIWYAGMCEIQHDGHRATVLWLHYSPSHLAGSVTVRYASTGERMDSSATTGTVSEVCIIA